jgi:hypothetical protein
MKTNRWPLDHSLGFIPIQPKLPSRVHRLHQKVRISGQPLDFASSVKGREAKLLDSCNLTGGNRRPLNLRPYCEAALKSTLFCGRDL